MKTHYFDRDSLDQAGSLLAQGALVAFPTETVYGLGANARSEAAVQRIFAAKGRPSDNPLIVHIAKTQDLVELVQAVSPTAQKLIDRFWPGPLTLVFPKTDAVPDAVTAGLNSVAIRIPEHPWALEILEHAGVPVAAPSANRSGSPSATTWEAVRDDLDGRVEGIVCGPPTDIGLESTVVDTTRLHPRVLRPGKVSYEELKKVCPDMEPYRGDGPSNDPPAGNDLSSSPHAPNSPGLRHRHYQPMARVQIVLHPESTPPKKTCYIGMQPPVPAAGYLSYCLVRTLEEYAQVLFDFFRKADRLGADRIECQQVPEIGLGTALMDRLKRASQRDE